MDNYVKGEVKEMDWSSPFPVSLVGPDVKCLKVRAGTKIQNIVTFAHKLFETEETRKVLFAGCSDGIAKTISCVEVFKRQQKIELFQLNKVCFRRTEEYWEPEVQGIDRLKVNRDVPVIFILISRDSLPDSETISKQKSTEPLPAWIRSQSKNVAIKTKKKKKLAANDAQQPLNKWKRKTKEKGASGDSSSSAAAATTTTTTAASSSKQI